MTILAPKLEKWKRDTEGLVSLFLKVDVFGISIHLQGNEDV